MSYLSWSTAVEKCLAGPSSSTCLPSALDCLYPNFEFPLWFYSFYEDAYRDQTKYGANKGRTKSVYTKLIHLLTGSTRTKQIVFKMVKSEDETEVVLQNALIGGWKVIICTQPSHVVGLKSISNKWQMVGNAVETLDLLTSRQVFKYLYIKRPYPRGTEKCPNIYLFPCQV